MLGMLKQRGKISFYETLLLWVYQGNIQRFFVFFFLRRAYSFIYLIKNMEEINFQMFTPGQHLKKNCDFLKI